MSQLNYFVRRVANMLSADHSKKRDSQVMYDQMPLTAELARSIAENAKVTQRAEARSYIRTILAPWIFRSIEDMAKGGQCKCGLSSCVRSAAQLANEHGISYPYVEVWDAAREYFEELGYDVTDDVISWGKPKSPIEASQTPEEVA